jgi:hypothetical protein
MQKATCEYCKKEFTRMAKFTGKFIYCSNECRNKGMSLHPAKPIKGKYKICPICKKEFYVCLGSIKLRKYCSRECHNKSQENHPILKCKVCGKDYRTYYSHIKWRGSNYCSKKCHNEGSSLFQTGENSAYWKGGISFENGRIRKAIEWKTWRKIVFERDNYTCQICGIRSSKKEWAEIHPHHIKSFSEYPDSRFDINNGLTLCKSCHHKLHGNLSKGKKINAKSRKELSSIL